MYIYIYICICKCMCSLAAEIRDKYASRLIMLSIFCMFILRFDESVTLYCKNTILYSKCDRFTKVAIYLQREALERWEPLLLTKQLLLRSVENTHYSDLSPSLASALSNKHSLSLLSVIFIDIYIHICTYTHTYIYIYAYCISRTVALLTCVSLTFSLLCSLSLPRERPSLDVDVIIKRLC